MAVGGETLTNHPRAIMIFKKLLQSKLAVGTRAISNDNVGTTVFTVLTTRVCIKLANTLGVRAEMNPLGKHREAQILHTIGTQARIVLLLCLFVPISNLAVAVELYF